ncbi:MAG: hypothetical protein VB021_01490 [Oscillospiraceae bacterium]|nr:hypothetical protein [Oscillospiraceae bacterium]
MQPYNSNMSGLSGPYTNNTNTVTNDSWVDSFSKHEAQNLSSHKGYVSGNDMSFSEFVKNVKSFGNAVRFYFGKVSSKLSNKIKTAAGKDLLGYNIAIRSDEIMHAFNEHGNEKSELLRGHLPVTEESIQQLPKVFEDPDKVQLLPTKDYAGRVAFEIQKQMDGYVVAVVGIADGRHSIEIDSMRITKRKALPLRLMEITPLTTRPKRATVQTLLLILYAQILKTVKTPQPECSPNTFRREQRRPTKRR